MNKKLRRKRKPKIFQAKTGWHEYDRIIRQNRGTGTSGFVAAAYQGLLKLGGLCICILYMFIMFIDHVFGLVFACQYWSGGNLPFCKVTKGQGCSVLQS